LSDYVKNMSNNEMIEKDDGLELAQKMAEEEGRRRKTLGPSKYVIPTIVVI